MGSLVPEIIGGIIALAWLSDHYRLKSKLSHLQVEYDAKKNVSEYIIKAKESLIHKLEQQVMRLNQESDRYKPVDDLLKAKLLETEQLKKEVLTLKAPIPETVTIKARSAGEVRKMIEEQNFLETETKKDA